MKRKERNSRRKENVEGKCNEKRIERNSRRLRENVRERKK